MWTCPISRKNVLGISDCCYRMRPRLKGHYFLAVKDNQKYLHEAVVDAFRFHGPSNEATEMEGDHGRVETRTCRIMPADKIEDKEVLAKWPKLTTIVELESEVTQKKINTCCIGIWT